MREQPTWRIPVGVIGLGLGILLYGIAVASVVAPMIRDWPVLAQTPIYLVLGIVWIMPLRRYLIWMETGRWR